MNDGEICYYPQDHQDVAANLDKILPDDDEPMSFPPVDPQDIPIEDISDDDWTDESLDEDCKTCSKSTVKMQYTTFKTLF